MYVYIYTYVYTYIYVCVEKIKLSSPPRALPTLDKSREWNVSKKKWILC